MRKLGIRCIARGLSADASSASEAESGELTKKIGAYSSRPQISNLFSRKKFAWTVMELMDLGPVSRDQAEAESQSLIEKFDGGKSTAKSVAGNQRKTTGDSKRQLRSTSVRGSFRMNEQQRGRDGQQQGGREEDVVTTRGTRGVAKQETRG